MAIHARDVRREPGRAGSGGARASRPIRRRWRAGWSSRVDEVLKEATLKRPADVPYAWHGKRGQHSEHLSRLLAEMQFMQRTYPGAQW